MEEKIFVGYGYGKFKNDQGNIQDYCNVFVLEEFSGSENDEYHYGGQKAVKYRCVDPGVFEGIAFGSKVECYFDSKKRIAYMTIVD